MNAPAASRIPIPPSIGTQGGFQHGGPPAGGEPAGGEPPGGAAGIEIPVLEIRQTKTKMQLSFFIQIVS